MLEYSQEYDIIDIIRSEHKKLKSWQIEVAEWREKHKEYISLIEECKLKFDDSITYKKVIDDNLKKASKALNIAKQSSDMLNEFIGLDAYSVSVDTFRPFDQQIKEFKDELLEYIDENIDVTKQLMKFTSSFLCEQYGGFCKVENCAERHKKQSFFKRTKTKCIVSFKNRFSFVNKKKC